MTSLQQQIGLRIKELRQLKGYTQAELAELTDLSTNYVGYIERGERTVSLQTLERLTHILGVEIGTLFLFRSREASKKSEEPSQRSQMMVKLTSFLQRADREDLRLLFKLTKRLVQNLRP